MKITNLINNNFFMPSSKQTVAININNINEINSNAKSLLSSYKEARDTFYTELNDHKDNLTNSIKKIKTLDEDLDQKDALNVINDLVKDYNNMSKFLNDNTVSKKVTDLSKQFSNLQYYSSLYESIGLNIDNNTLSINEDKLTEAWDSNPSKVKDIITLLADKSNSYLSFTKEDLFPTVQSMFGDQLKTASLYTGNAFIQMNNYNNVGNLINMLL